MKTALQPGFDGASLKVKRAYRHIEELKAIIDEIGSDETNRLTLSKKPDGGFALAIDELGKRGAFIPLVVGDAIHNLRAPFDHIWMTLWRASKQTGFGTFPFHETRKNLEDTVAKSPVKIAFPDVERLILDEVKPYREPNGNELLWTITKLDNIDKHNLVVPTLNVHHVAHLTVRAGAMAFELTDCSFANVGSLFGSNMPVTYQQNGKITIDPTFPEGDLLSGQSILPTLLDMADATDKTVELFRSTFL